MASFAKTSSTSYHTPTETRTEDALDGSKNAQRAISTPNMPKAVRNAQMTYQTLITSILLSSSLFLPNQALARPDMTPEQLAKARELATQIKPPVDFDALLDEADRLGVDCSKLNLTIRANIKTCRDAVEIAQMDEEIKASKEREAQLREETIQIINDLADKAEQKLQQMQ